MGFVFVVIMIIGAFILASGCDAIYHGINEQGKKRAKELNKENFYTILLGLGIMLLGVLLASAFGLL